MVDLAIDIGGTYIKYALVDHTYQIRQFWKAPTRQSGKRPLYDYIIQNIPSDISFGGIGVSAPGVLIPNGTVCSRASSALAELYGTNICQELYRRMGCSVAAINDGNAAALFEARFGAARNTQSSITIVIGTGIGGGLCYNGALIEGTAYAAGEFHMIPYIGPDGKRHKLGDLCKIKALQENYYYVVGKTCSADEIFTRSAGGEAAAAQVVDRWLSALTTLLITLTAVYDPDMFCIGGAISQNKLLIDGLSRRYVLDGQTYFGAPARVGAKVVPCSNYNGSNLLGAMVNYRSCVPAKN